MQNLTELSFKDPSCPTEYMWFFFAKWDLESAVFVNDPTHLAVKLHRRLMTKNIVIGTKRACRAILYDLVETLDKTDTGISKSDLSDNSDVMRYEIVEKVHSERIIHLLTEPQQEATKFYLTLTLFTIKAFLDVSQKPKYRIYHAWFVVFALHLWRSHTIDVPDTAFQNDFVSLNTFICAELNAHSC